SPQTKTAARLQQRRAADNCNSRKKSLVGNPATKGLALGNFDLLAREERINRVLDVALRRLVLIVVERADVGDVAVLVEHEDVRRDAGAIFGGQLAGLIKDIREVESFFFRAGLHRCQVFGPLVRIDCDELDSFARILFAELDEPVFIGDSHRAEVAGKANDDHLRILQVAEAIFLSIDTRKRFESRRMCPDLQLSRPGRSTESDKGERQKTATKHDKTPCGNEIRAS